MDKREQLQEEWKSKFCQQVRAGNKKHVLNIFQRCGKTPVTLKILKELGLLNKKILISYPDNKILSSWGNAMEKFNISLSNVTFTNTASLKKYSNEKWDVYIQDECSDFSEEEEKHIKKLYESEYVLALSGTISKESEERLRALGLRILIKYSNEEAIGDGLIADYSIEVVTVPLSEIKNLKDSKKRNISEKKKYDNYSYVMTKLRNEGKNTMFLALQRNRILQGSHAKLLKLKLLLNNYSKERILIFTGLIKMAEQLGIPTFHSKSKDATVFDRFIKREFSHMAVAKIGESGVSFPSLDRVILSSFTYDEEATSQIISRCMMLDYEGKTAKITILCSTEEAEIKKLKKTLSDFNENKIIWK